MNQIEFQMVHSCVISRKYQDYRLGFSSGSHPFMEDRPVTGLLSEAVAAIKTVVIESGSWEDETAAGYLIVYGVAGSFEDGEIITDDQDGQADVSGSLTPLSDELGNPSQTTISTTTKCLFTETDISGFGGIGVIAYDSGDYIADEPILILPANTVIDEGDIVTGISYGYERDYEVKKVKYAFRMFTSVLDHKEAKLRTVVKRVRQVRDG